MRKILGALAIIVAMLVAGSSSAVSSPTPLDGAIIADAPEAYYAMTEPAGSTSAADSSGNHAPALTQAGTGTAVSFDGEDGVVFSRGKFLRATLPAAPAAVECWFSTTTRDTSPMIVMNVGAPDNPIVVYTDGRLRTVTTDLTSPVVTDGAWHHLVWQAGHVFLDGVDIGVPTISPDDTASKTVSIGGRAVAGFSAWAFTGRIAHVAAYVAPLATSQAQAHFQVGFTNFWTRMVVRVRGLETTVDRLRGRIGHLRHKVHHQRKMIRHLRAEIRRLKAAAQG